MAKRTNGQRLAISDQFQIVYQESLCKKLKSRLSGNLGNVVEKLLIPLPQLYASELSNDPNHHILIETLFTLNSAKVFLVKNEFNESKYQNQVS